MVRNYKTPLGSKPNRKYDPDKLKEALTAIEEGISIREAAETYDISKSVLQRQSSREVNKKGHPCAIPSDVEDSLTKVLLTCADWGCPQSVLDMRHFVKSYLDRRGMRIKQFKDNLPGNDWAEKFILRYPELRNRDALNIRRNRAKLSIETLSEYFDHLERSLEGIPPSNIANYDETNLQDDPGRKKLLTRRKTKYAERIIDSSKSAVSIMYGGFADGTMMNPYVVYKSVNMWDCWVVGGPEGTIYNRTKSGWFDSRTFDDWFMRCALPPMKRLEGKKALIGDNLACHFSLRVVEECEKNNIQFIFFPGGATHICQVM